MSLKETLTEVLHRSPTELDLAGHVADCISAQEQLRAIARQDGDITLLEVSTQRIQELKRTAIKEGLLPEEYRSIFKRF